jgi:CheY-like chemotaxis protein
MSSLTPETPTLATPGCRRTDPLILWRHQYTMTEPVDLPHLIIEVIAEVQPAADAKGVHVAATNLAAMPRWVEADEAALRRILLNTLDLVVGAATDGTVVLRLDEHDADRDRWICVIAWRGDDDAVIEEVKSAFVMTLPRVPGSDADRPLDVLVVDDSAQHRSMVAAYLDKSPHTVVECEGGAEAVAQVQSHTFDVVLMDLQMPGMNGLDAIQAIRAFETTHDRPPVYIVALTAMGASDDVSEAEGAGANDCLAKPVSRSALIKTLAAMPQVATPEPVAEPEPIIETTPRSDLSSSQLLALARHQVGAILATAPGTQVERLRLLGHHLKSTAADAGLADIAHLATALEDAGTGGSLKDTQTAARTLQAWITMTQG